MNLIRTEINNSIISGSLASNNDPNFNRTYADYLFNTRRITSTGYQLLLTSLSQGNAEFEAMLDTIITSANTPISTQPARRSTSTNTPPSPTFVPTRAQRWNAQTNQSSVGNNENNVWLERSHQGLEDASVVAGSKKYSNVLGGFWRGINNKWYDIRSNFWGNQYAGSKMNAINNFEMYEGIGRKLYGLGMGLSLYKIMEDFNNHEYFTLNTGKDALDLVMATIGERSPLGLIVFTIYTLSGNWVSAVKNNTKTITEQYQAATGEDVWASNSRIWMGYGE